MFTGFIENVFQITANVVADDYKNGIICTEEFIERNNDLYEQWVTDGAEEVFSLPLVFMT